MASFSTLSFFFLFAAFLSVINVCIGDTFKVGDLDGWREPEENVSDFYSQWAGSNQFHVGDSLVFEYKNDSVLQVNKWAYYHCNTKRPISNSNNGDNIYHLNKVGPAYFISGTYEHCKRGQRLLVNVMVRSPPSIAHSPDLTSYMAPAPSPHSHSGSDVLATASLTLAMFFSAIFYFA